MQNEMDETKQQIEPVHDVVIAEQPPEQPEPGKMLCGIISEGLKDMGGKALDCEKILKDFSDNHSVEKTVKDLATLYNVEEDKIREVIKGCKCGGHA